MAEPEKAVQYRTPLHDFGLPALARMGRMEVHVSAAERTANGYVSLRGKVGDMAFMAAAHRVLGINLPVSPCSCVRSGTTEIFWLSPDEWLVIAPRAAVQDLVAKLQAALTAHTQVTNVSGGFTELELVGPRARDLLSHCTVYDLDRLCDGHAAGSTFGKASAVFRRDGEKYVILFRRSFADYIWRFLMRAAEPYGLAIHEVRNGSGA